MYGLKSQVKITPVTKIKACSQGAAAFSSLLIFIFLSSHIMRIVLFFLKNISLSQTLSLYFLRVSLRFLFLSHPLHVSLPSHLTSGAVSSFFIRAVFIVALLGLYKCCVSRTK